MVLAGRSKLRVSKNFSQGDIFLYLLNFFATAVPKLKQKISKKYSSILAIVNHWNWLNDSPPLKLLYAPNLFDIYRNGFKILGLQTYLSLMSLFLFFFLQNEFKLKYFIIATNTDSL